MPGAWWRSTAGTTRVRAEPGPENASTPFPGAAYNLSRMRKPRVTLALALAVLGGCWRPEPPAVPDDPPHRSPPSSTWMAPPAEPPPAAPASAATAAPEPLTRSACVREALRANRPYRNAESAFARSGLGIAVAAAQVFAPSLTAAYTVDNDPENAGSARVGIKSTAAGFDIEPYVRFGYDQNRTTPAGGPYLSDYESAAGIAVTRKLFNISESLRKRLPVSQAERAYWSAANDLAIRARQLEYDAARSFLEVQRNEARVAMRRRSTAQTAEYLAAMKDQVAKGFKAPLEQLNAEISANQDQADLVSDETADRNAREALNQLLGRPVTAGVAITPEDLAAATAAVPEPPLERDVVRITSQHESLGTRRLDIDNAIEQVRIQRDQLMPQVTAALTAEEVRSGSTTFNREEGRDGRDRRAALTLTWELPLDGWRGARGQLAQAERQLQELGRQLEEDRDALERRLRAIHRRLEQLRRSEALAVARLDAERARQEATLRRWQAGAVDNLEVTRSKQTVDTAELNLLNTRVDLLLAWAEYRSLLPVKLAP